MKRIYPVLLAAVGALLGTLVVVVAAPAAPTPIVGGSSFGAAVLITPTIEFVGTVSTTHTSDYFYFNVAPGQIATVMFTSTANFSNTVFFYLYDQGQAQLWSQSLTGPSQANKFVYMGDNGAPTKYYFRASNNALQNQYLFQVILADQTDGGQTGDAGDTIGTARVLTPAASGITSYAGNHLGDADTDDWYRINAVPGQIISVTVTVQDWGGAGALSLYLDDQAGTQLGASTITSPNPSTNFLGWVSNNSVPSAYILRVYSNFKSPNLLVYKIDVEMSQQSDAGMPGDAGDNFASARTITLTAQSPSLTAPGNLLAASDTDDYYLIKLPPTPPFQQPVRYNFSLGVTKWPASNASITLSVYDALQNPLSALGKTIFTPSTQVFSEEVTNQCSTDGCYFRVHSGYSGNNQVIYTIKMAPAYFLYMPTLSKP